MSSSSPVIQLREVRERTAPPGEARVPLFESGFRAFFFGATLAAVFLVPAWLVVLSGETPAIYWSSVLWHSHEMLFGYTTAVVAGFLLTASSNWTKLPVASGWSLAGLFALWALGRVLPLVMGAPAVLVAVVDVSFLPALGFVLGRAMLRTENRRNYFFVVLLALLSGANVLYHLERWGMAVPAGLGRDLSLRVVAMMILVMGGRVFPMFTRNATGGSAAIRSVPWLDRVALSSFLLAALSEQAGVGSLWVGLLFTLAGFANAARMSTWGVGKAQAPLLWILHAGYFATALSFVLQGAFLWGMVPYASSLHCFTIGGVGLLTLGMMARVSLGHSGRMLAATPTITLAFTLLVGAALVRVLVPLVAPSYVALSWQASGVLWTLAFALFLRFGVPVWFRPRVD